MGIIIGYVAFLLLVFCFGVAGQIIIGICEALFGGRGSRR